MPNPTTVSETAWLLVNLLPVIVGAIVTITVTVVSRRDTKAQLEKAQESVDQTLEQVRNTHTQNLREDLDEKFRDMGSRIDTVTEHVTALRDDVGGLHSETRDLRKDVTGIRTDARRSRRDIAAQQEAIDSLPSTIEKVIHEHTSDCPARPRPNSSSANS